jgi:hypothetical protein
LHFVTPLIYFLLLVIFIIFHYFVLFLLYFVIFNIKFYYLSEFLFKSWDSPVYSLESPI